MPSLFTPRSFSAVGLTHRITYHASRITFLVLFLSTIYYLSSIISPAYAADPPDPPDPKPCFNPVETDNLTDNYVTDENGIPPIVLNVHASGKAGVVTASKDFSYYVDFSKLQAIFGAPNSDYIEGHFQDPTHQQAKLLELNSAQLLNFQGPEQKAVPKVMTDALRQKYIKYVYGKNTLAEADSKFTDYNGDTPMTIYEMVDAFGGLPTLPQNDTEKAAWNISWGKYWEKIPTAYDEFYIGKLEFKPIAGQKDINSVLRGDMCINQTVRTIEFPVPNFFRTAATSGGQNLTMVPRIAQAPDNDLMGIKSAIGGVASTVGDFVQNCFKFAKNTPLAKAIQKISKVSLEIFTTKNALAAALDQKSCIKATGNGKEGNAPFCALYPKKADGSENVVVDPPERRECQNVQSQLKLNDETNVQCTFNMTWSKELMIPDDFDSCSQPDPINRPDFYSCSIKVYIYPDFRVPFLCQIQNNTNYSNEEEPCPRPQETGRGGVYTNFTPQAAQPVDPIQQMIDDCTHSSPSDGVHIPTGCTNLVNWITEPAQSAQYSSVETCVNNNLLNIPNLVNCFVDVARSIPRELPGQANQANNVLGANTQSSASGQVLAAEDNEKQRMIGGVDCAKHTSRDVTLKPKVLQDSLGIGFDCDLTGTTQPPASDPDPDPDTRPGTGCDGSTNFANLLPNPIPLSSPNASSPSLLGRIDSNLLDAARYGSTRSGVSCELLIGLHYVEAGWDSSSSFISGRTIGNPEPDVPSASACTSYGGSWTATGCVFTSLSDTAYYAGDHIKDKMAAIVGTWRPPTSFNEMIGAMSYYNGGGNSNCGESVPYTSPCPPPIGIDDPYAVSHFDSSHEQMYLIYCADLTRCSPPKLFARDGAATAAKEFYKRP